MPVQDSLSGNKSLPHGSIANFEKFEYNDKTEHHSKFPVAVEEIEILEKIFGTDVSTLNEITTIQRPNLVADDFIIITIELIQNNQ